MKYLTDFVERFHPKFRSDLKKLEKNIIKEIKDIHLPKILKDPFLYDKLKGNLSQVRSYHFKSKKVEYRIAYTIEDKEIIFYLMVAKRENFYNKLTKRFK